MTRPACEFAGLMNTVSAVWLDALRPLLAAQWEEGPPTLQMEPHPDGGAYLLALTTTAMVVIHDEAAIVSRAARVVVPRRILDACRAPRAPRLLTERGMVQGPDLPGAMIPDLVRFWDFSVWVAPRDTAAPGLLAKAMIERGEDLRGGYRVLPDLIEGWRAGIPEAHTLAPAHMILAPEALRPIVACADRLDAAMEFYGGGTPDRPDPLLVRFSRTTAHPFPDVSLPILALVMPYRDRSRTEQPPLPAWLGLPARGGVVTAS